MINHPGDYLAVHDSVAFANAIPAVHGRHPSAPSLEKGRYSQVPAWGCASFLIVSEYCLKIPWMQVVERLDDPLISSSFAELET
jgi:hypothetical protein